MHTVSVNLFADILHFHCKALCRKWYGIGLNNSSSYPANICLDEGVLKTSFVFVFRRRLQDILIKADIFALVIRLQKMSSRSLGQDQYIRLGHTSSRQHFQDVFKMSSRPLAKTSSRLFWRLLQDVLQRSPEDIFKKSSRPFEDVFKTSSRRLAKISSRRFQDVLSS